MGEIEFGKCDICGKESGLSRTYFYYNIPCECYGCICYGAGLIDDCKKNVEILREYYKNSKNKHDKRRVDKKDRNT